ncbi:hypothetical protein G6F56_007795 [Rhizopus delemar]|nr:hypothetical protein G6F56_007795 [Rhizopus delemar]
MFVIPKKNGGYRPVFNLKKLNEFIHAPTFKMETIQDVSRMMTKNDWMTSIDLSDAFLHIPIHPSFRKYLRFHWKGQSYQFCTTPFGLSVVPWLFTKLTRPILEWARSQQIRISAYLDDWIITADSPKQSRLHTQVVLQKLEDLGWLINQKKSILSPSQTMEHLGFSLNSTQMTAKLPGKKLRDLRRSIQQVLNNPYQSPRTIHSLTMRIQAATFAILPARLYTQYLLRLKNNTVKSIHDWDRPQPLTNACLKELTWWKNNLTMWNGRSILPQTPQETIFVDASNSGWGCSLQQDQQTPLTAHGHWTHEESKMSINWQELKAAQLALQTFKHLHNMTILIRTDNITSMSYNNKQGGTRSLALMELATTVWRCRLRVETNLRQEHLANQTVDFPVQDSTTMGTSRYRPVRRPDHSPPTKLRILAPRPESSLVRRIHCSLDPMVQPIYGI